MSTFNAREFLEDLETDHQLELKFKYAAPDDLDDVLEFAHHQGYDFDAEAFNVALQTYPKSRLARKFGQPNLRISPFERERPNE
jgi:hypothetical protein